MILNEQGQALRNVHLGLHLWKFLKTLMMLSAVAQARGDETRERHVTRGKRKLLGTRQVVIVLIMRWFAKMTCVL